MMRLCWVERISNLNIDKIRKEIGDRYNTDIEAGISQEALEKVTKYYINNKINP